MPHPKELLARFNLSEQESTIYLALLSLGKAGATQISKKTGLNRTAVYFHVNHLIEKKFVHHIRSGKIIKYLAVPPKDLAETFDRWTTDFKSLIPWMESLNKIETETPRIEVSESREGYHHLYDEISCLPVGSVIRVLEGQKAMVGEFTMTSQEHWAPFWKRLIERKIETKALFTQESARILSTRAPKNAKSFMKQRIWHLRTMEDQRLPFQNLIVIYGRKVSFVFPTSSLVVSIEHREIVESLTCVFEALYQFGKPSSWFSF